MSGNFRVSEKLKGPTSVALKISDLIISGYNSDQILLDFE